MRIDRFSIAFVGLWVVGLSAVALQGSPPDTVPSRVEAVLAAAGGQEKLLKLFRLEERVLITATPTPLKPDDKPNRTSTVEVGGRWWVGNTLRDKDKVRVLCWAWSLRVLLEPKSKIEMLPDATIGDAAVIGLRVSESVAEPIDLWFDAETKRLVAIDYTDTRHVFSELKTTDAGHRYPSHVTGYRFIDRATKTTSDNQWYQTDILSLVPLDSLPDEAAAKQEQAQTSLLKYVPAPPDNPLKGLVPYSRRYGDRFPHSMEFNYLPLSDLMTGPEEFDWQPLEKLLDDIALRRHQTVFRIWMEYPGRDEGIPKFLEQGGLRVTEWGNTNTAPFPEKKVRTPDYSDPRLQAALKSFITALGGKYDGDPRIGYITAGLLGTWGEWHTYPRTELMASKEVQSEVMDAYERAFRKTPVLLRYPAGDGAWAHAANHRRRLGYHDDSFAWATLDTGRMEDNWFFLSAMKAAGAEAIDKWKTCPIGGEIRPELWGKIFDDRPTHPQAQDFAECVRETHVTWLMDTGMFREKPPDRRIKNAIRQVQRMGYEFHIESAERRRLPSGGTVITIRIRNTGIAPFYHPWKVELATVSGGRVVNTIDVDWSVLGLQPGDGSRTWTTEVTADQQGSAAGFAVRIANPLPNGLPLRFANDYESDSPDGWWLIP